VKICNGSLGRYFDRLSTSGSVGYISVAVKIIVAKPAKPMRKVSVKKFFIFEIMELIYINFVIDISIL
jgi:hypothetical protein